MKNKQTVPIIEMCNIVKSFYGIKALNNMNIQLGRGEILCLVGENGAGKSTLMKVLSGAYRPDSGTIIVEGKEYGHMTAELSKELGVNIIYQENLLIPWMNVAENIYLGQEIGKGGIVSFREQNKKAEELCEYFGVKLNLNRTVDELSVAEQQYVKILKALSTNPKILILDEPTSMFNTEDANKVLKIVQNIAESGVSMIYISHFLNEVQQIADKITVIRDGAAVKTYDNAGREMDMDRVVSDMVGRDASMFYEKEENEIGEDMFEVKDLIVSPHAKPVSFSVKKGEILGFAGMVGSGRTEIMDAIAGASPKYGGKIFYEGQEITIKNPVDSIRHKIAYITEDRQRLGLNLDAPISENLMIVGLQTEKISKKIINVKKLVPLLKNVIEGLNIKMASPKQEVKSLSGGNQQKVVLGKWLFTDSNVFIFDEPTRGIDVNAKAEFYKIMSDLTRKGKSIIMVSSDMPELVSMSDRVAVIRDGKITGFLERDEISEDSVIRFALGVEK